MMDLTVSWIGASCLLLYAGSCVPVTAEEYTLLERFKSVMPAIGHCANRVIGISPGI